MWICCQLGGRDHYAVPRALSRVGNSVRLITDAWIPPRLIPFELSSGVLSRLADRFHPELKNATVTGMFLSLLQFEITAALQGVDGWDKVMARNRWFEGRAVAVLEALDRRGELSDQKPVVFAYSYAAEGIFQWAKTRGWTTVLGQIDPGPREEQIVARLFEASRGKLGSWQPAPAAYWDGWRRECDTADKIVVNSEWSRSALESAGIPKGKLHVVPLAFEAEQPRDAWQRTYPEKFSTARPMRVLFLGQINLRKGIAVILDAARRLVSNPVEFWFVGKAHVDFSKEILPSNIKWIGSVPRNAVADYYKAADVFLFPTFSDGFGLTQLEAQWWYLPMITSRFCGDVVCHDYNGIVLHEITEETISDAVARFLGTPELLLRFSERARSRGMKELGQSLQI